MTPVFGNLQASEVTSYLAFVLDLYHRFDREGAKLFEPLAQKSKKPMLSVLRAAARRTPERGGLIAEFGVHKGHSIRELAQMFPERTIHGFDSFKGFPNDGRADWRQDFSVAALPEVPASVQLHQGYFSETLPAFIDSLDDDTVADFLHIDCDIYSSSAEVFSALSTRIVPDTVLLFDELVNYDEFLWNEMLALYEWTRASGFGVRWLVKKGTLRPLTDYVSGVEGGFVGYRRRGWYQNAAVTVCHDPERDEREAGYLSAAKALAEQLFAGPHA